MKTIGQVAYEAFFNNAPTRPEVVDVYWDGLETEYKQAWEKTAIEIMLATVSVDMAVHVLVNACHGAADKAGWWVNPKTGVDVRDNPMCFSNKIALAHSELSEALEGDRKNKMDDHLPHLPSRDVELADALIRICDTAGGFGMALAQATVEKLAYNAQRADHKVENRAKEGGKAY